MIDSKIPRIIKEKIINNKVWQIISFFENGIEKFDVIYFYKSDTEKMAEELISSKKKIKTFESIKKAVKFLERLK